MQQFLVSLGAGFAFVGRHVHLEIGGEDYYLDLLFYHLKLRCFVVIDLKARELTPEASGKMNFSLSAVDDRLRHRDDQPSIGLLLCRGKSRLTVEYALRDVKKAIGVAEWRTRLVAVRVGKFNFAANGRALASDAADGFVKLIADATTDRLLGAQILGRGAGELISEVVAHMSYGGSAEDLARTIHAHPTMSEAVKEAALAVSKSALHAL